MKGRHFNGWKGILLANSSVLATFRLSVTNVLLVLLPPSVILHIFNLVVMQRSSQAYLAVKPTLRCNYCSRVCRDVPF